MSASARSAAGSPTPAAASGGDEGRPARPHGGCSRCAPVCNPCVGANGAITCLAERVPLVNNAVQAVHKVRQQEAALLRARKRNPLGAHGYLTRAGERLPVVNNFCRCAHKLREDEDALARARERDPMGVDGYVTLTAEHVPVLADMIMAWHRRAGNLDAAERARAHALVELCGKDGAVTKVAELLPVSNLVAAVFHAAAGNKGHARRALNLVQSWRDMGKPDSALCKVFELLPGMDILPFALHLNCGNYAQAIRSVVKTRRVSVEVEGCLSTSFCPSISQVQLLDMELRGVEIHPKGVSAIGALLDVATNFLELDKEGGRRRNRRARRAGAAASSPMGPQASDACSSPKSTAPPSTVGGRSESRGTISVPDTGSPRSVPDKSVKSAKSEWSVPQKHFRGQLQELLVKRINEDVADAMCMLADRIPDMVMWALNGILARDCASLPPYLRLDPLPYPRMKLQEVMRTATPALTIRHGPVPPLVAAQAAPSCGLRPRATLAASGACCLAGCVAGGSACGVLGCLGGGVAGLWACLAGLHQLARQVTAPALNGYNAKVCREAHVPAEWRGKTAAPTARCDLRGAAPEADDEEGLVIDMQPEHLRQISDPCREWFLDDVLFERGGRLVQTLGPAILDPAVRPLLGSLFHTDCRGQVPLALEIELPMFTAGAPPVEIPMGPIKVVVQLSLSFVEVGYIRRARVFLSDATVAKVLEAIQAAVGEVDLRTLDPRLEGFTQPVHARFELGMTWPEPSKNVFEVRAISCTLHLPE